MLKPSHQSHKGLVGRRWQTKHAAFFTSLFAVHWTMDGNVDRPSATDKTLIVASINGKPVIVGLNAYIKPGS